MPDAPPPLSLDCRLAQACELAYQIEVGPAGAPRVPESAAYRAAQIATVHGVFDRGTRRIDAGYVASTADGWVVVALRGTLPPSFKGDPVDWLRWIDDWLQDFRLDPVPWAVGYTPGGPSGPPDRTPYGHVEKGFAEAVLDLWDPAGPVAGIRGVLDELAQSGALGRARGVLVTGHSKGAAGAPLVSSLIRGSHPGVPVRTVGFAMPLTCDAVFRTCYGGAGLDATTLRYQNEYDVVPLLPWYPVHSLRASIARALERHTHASAWRLPGGNDYVPLGANRFITAACTIEPGVTLAEAAHRVVDLVWHDGLDLAETLGTIADAHSLVHNATASYPTGRYTTCVCGAAAPTAGSVTAGPATAGP